MATFAEYWDGVLGSNRDAVDVVRDFDLADSDRRVVDEWLGTAESEAKAQGADIAVSDADRETVLDRLVSAIENRD